MGCDSDMGVLLASIVHCCCIPGCIKAKDSHDSKQLKSINVLKTRTWLACSTEVLPNLLHQLLKWSQMALVCVTQPYYKLRVSSCTQGFGFRVQVHVYISITVVESYTGKYHEFVAVCIVTSAQHE